MISEIKLIVKNMIDNMKLTEYVYGEVVTINPLSIKIDQKLTIPSSVIILTSAVKEKTINLQHTHLYLSNPTSIESPSLIEVIVNESLQVGDKVTMLRVDKGQKFIVLDKVV